MHKHKNSSFKYIDKPIHCSALIYIDKLLLIYLSVAPLLSISEILVVINQSSLTYRDSIFSTGLCGKLCSRHKATSKRAFDFLMLDWPAKIHFIPFQPPILVRGRTSNPSPCHSNCSHQSNDRWALTHFWFIIYIQIRSAVSSRIKVLKWWWLSSAH